MCIIPHVLWLWKYILQTHGELWGVSGRGYQKELRACARCLLEALRKQGFALGGVLPGSGVMLWLGALLSLIQTKGRLTWCGSGWRTGKAAAASPPAGTGGCLVIFVVWTMFPFVCVHTWLWSGLVSSQSVTSQRGLSGCWCPVRWENARPAPGWQGCSSSLRFPFFFHLSFSSQYGVI